MTSSYFIQTALTIKVKKIAIGNKEHITDRKWEPRFY